MKLLALHLATHQPAAVAAFYAEALQLPVRRTAAGDVAVTVGHSQLLFQLAAAGTAPFYHVAFLIPANQIVAAQQWLAGRVALLPVGPGQLIADFVGWEAQALYFHDPAGNILELIARRPLHNAATTEFGPASWLGLSEVGVVVPDVAAFREQLAHNAGVPPFARGPSRPDFVALGTDAGLLIAVQEGRGWFPTGRPVEQHPLQLRYRHAGQEHTLCRFAPGSAKLP